MEQKKQIFSSHVYDILKWIAMPFLPALVLLFQELSNIFQSPALKTTSLVIAALEVFLTAILQYDNFTYRKNNNIQIIADATPIEYKEEE